MIINVYFAIYIYIYVISSCCAPYSFRSDPIVLHGRCILSFGISGQALQIHTAQLDISDLSVSLPAAEVVMASDVRSPGTDHFPETHGLSRVAQECEAGMSIH